MQFEKMTRYASANNGLQLAIATTLPSVSTSRIDIMVRSNDRIDPFERSEISSSPSSLPVVLV